MIEGLEIPPPAQDLEKPRDTVKRDMSEFYSKDHDFSIVLTSKRKGPEQKVQTIEVSKPIEEEIKIEEVPQKDIEMPVAP